MPRSLPEQTAFTLIELLVVIAIIGILAAILLPVLSKAKTRAQASKCMGNLKQMGSGTLLYLEDNSDKLMLGGLRYRVNGTPYHFAWDDLLQSYVGGSMNAAQRMQDGAPALVAPALLRCPSDKVAITNTAATPAAGARRSYAMPEHNMGAIEIPAGAGVPPNSWPPNSSNKTGVGLRYDASVGAPSGWDANADPINGARDPGYQAAIVVSLVQDSGGTILITERIDPDNIVGRWQDSVLGRANNHIGTVPGQTTAQASKALHNDSFNYLMVDGHVEFLIPEATLSRTNNAAVGPQTRQDGMWSILAGD